MSDADRELRDRLEAAQSELKRATTRLDALEGVAADRDVLKQQLELAQAELKAANERLDELEGQSTEALQAALDEVTQDRDLLRQRLEQADKTREQWDHKVSQRDAELQALRGELQRLRTVASQTTEVRTPSGAPRWVLAMSAAVLVAITALLVGSC